MLWIYITIPLAVLGTMIAVVPLLIGIAVKNREQAPSNFERKYHDNLRTLKARPEAMEEAVEKLRRAA